MHSMIKTMGLRFRQVSTAMADDSACMSLRAEGMCALCHKHSTRSMQISGTAYTLTSALCVVCIAVQYSLLLIRLTV